MIKAVSYSGYKGRNRQHQLARLNLVTGPNGSGKTAIYEAINIAIKGKHPTAGDTLQSIKPYCEPSAAFEIMDDLMHIRRSITFGAKASNGEKGEKTEHLVEIDGDAKKVKEAQDIIDGVFLDAMMRLDIGKFSKMNDVERGIVLSELLGSSKVNVKDVALDLMDLFFRKNPESDYIIKYKLNADPNNYDKVEFVKVMRETYKSEKNPVLTEVIDNMDAMCSAAKTEVVDMAEYLDVLYENVKKYKNGKAQEKQFAQKAWAENSTSLPDIKELTETVAETEKVLSGISSKIGTITTLVAQLNANVVTSSLDDLKANIAECDEIISENTDKLQELENIIKENNSSLEDINKSLDAWRSYNNWNANLRGTEERLAEAIKKRDELSNSMAPESKASLKSLEAAKAAYISLKDLPAGECPTCGSVISEAQSNQRKEKIKAAKAAYDPAVKELKVRQDNSYIKAKIELANQDIEHAEKAVKTFKANKPEKPMGPSMDSLEAQRKAALESNAEANRRKADLNSEITAKTSARAYSVAETDKHARYAKLLNDNMATLELYGAIDNPVCALQESIAHLNTDKTLNEGIMAEAQAKLQLHKRLTEEQERIVNIQAQVDVLSAWVDIVRQYKNEAVQKKIEPVQLLAKKYYPRKGDEIVLTPKTIGVNRNGVYIPSSAMSAGESLSLMSAVLISIMEASGAKPSYLFVDAAEIDESNMDKVMKALETSNVCTVIVAHHQNIQASDNWNVIRLDLDGK